MIHKSGLRPKLDLKVFSAYIEYSNKGYFRLDGVFSKGLIVSADVLNFKVQIAQTSPDTSF